MEKQIFASLEIADHEIRLILGEFHNTRFNVLKTERVECASIEKSSNTKYDSLKIKNKDQISNTIKKMLDNASSNVGAKIENVILSIPSTNVVRKAVTITQRNEDYNRLITPYEINRAYKKAMDTPIDNQHIVVNAICSKFIYQGNVSRKIPYNKVCDEYTMVIDLYMTNRQLTFDLVSCVEATGCKVLDICLDAYALAKEISLFEHEMNDNIILVKLEQQSTTISYFSENRLLSSRVLNEGYLAWGMQFALKQEVPKNVVASIILNNGRLNSSSYSDHVIYLWSKNNVKHVLSDRQLQELLQPSLKEWSSIIEEICIQKTETKNNRVILCGEGADIEGLDRYLEKLTGCDVKKYIPDTLGARTPALANCLGLFFAYKDHQDILGKQQTSINMMQFNKAIGVSKESKEIDTVSSDNENTITGKLKNIWFDFTSKKGKDE